MKMLKDGKMGDLREELFLRSGERIEKVKL